MYSVCVCVVQLRGMSGDNNSFQASLWYNEVTDRKAGEERGKLWLAELAAGPEINSVNLVYITLSSRLFLNSI